VSSHSHGSGEFARRQKFVLFCATWIAVISACGGEPEPPSVRDGLGPNRNAGGGSAIPGAGNGAAPPNFGTRPGVLPQIDPSTVPAGGSGCLNATVLFVVDGSGSMNEPFGSGTRWTSLRTALLDPMAGFIPRFQHEAQFGMMIYDGSIDALASFAEPMAGAMAMCSSATPANASAMCPRLVEVPPVLANMPAIDAMFPAQELGGSTPTHKAMNTAVDQMIASSTGKDVASNPHFIILATDGQPNDICMGGSGGDGSAQKACVIAAVDRAAAANITTYVISLAGQDMELEAHLAEVAKHGNPKDPLAHTFSPMTQEDLVKALREVLTSALGCVI
jgi:von Willebrand factor type A domain